MVVVVVSTQGANTRLTRFDSEGRLIKTHESIRPTAQAEDIETFRRSPSTAQRFGFASSSQAKSLGFGTLTV